jgi:hypothetical protein
MVNDQKGNDVVKLGMLEIVKTSIPVVFTVAIGLMVSLITLENKFDYQEVRASERYGILVHIKERVDANTTSLNNLEHANRNLAGRVKRIESYVPGGIIKIERDLLALQKDFELVTYKLGVPNG